MLTERMERHQTTPKQTEDITCNLNNALPSHSRRKKIDGVHKKRSPSKNRTSNVWMWRRTLILHVDYQANMCSKGMNRGKIEKDDHSYGTMLLPCHDGVNFLRRSSRLMCRIVWLFQCFSQWISVQCIQCTLVFHIMKKNRIIYDVKSVCWIAYHTIYS